MRRATAPREQNTDTEVFQTRKKTLKQIRRSVPNPKPTGEELPLVTELKIGTQKYFANTELTEGKKFEHARLFESKEGNDENGAVKGGVAIGRSEHFLVIAFYSLKKKMCHEDGGAKEEPQNAEDVC